MRVANTDLVGHKPLYLSLTKIKGVGRMFANAVCTISGVNKYTKAGELTPEEVKKLEQVLMNPQGKMPEWLFNRRKDFETGDDLHILTSKLIFTQDNDVKRLKRIKSNRGFRHAWGLPLRGQRTGSNFRRTKQKASKAKKQRR